MPILSHLAGLYPVHLDKNQAMDVEDFVRQHRDVWIGIGEVGLDFWKVQAPEEREVQQEIFVRFIGLSKELGLPLNVHTRSAGRHAIELLLDQEAEKVQMHAFDGKASTAMRAVEAGYFFSVPPSIVRSRQKQKLVHRLPLSCLLVETDSPVLGPAPGVRNEPKNVTIAIDAIADIKAVAREHVMEIVYENTVGLYGNAVV